MSFNWISWADSIDSEQCCQYCAPSTAGKTCSDVNSSVWLCQIVGSTVFHCVPPVSVHRARERLSMLKVFLNLASTVQRKIFIAFVCALLRTAMIGAMLSKNDLGWKRACAELPEAASTALARYGADDPIVWAGLDDGLVAVQYVEDCCGPLDHDRVTWAGLLPELNALLLAAQRPCKAHVQRVARMSGLQVSIDQADRLKAACERQEGRTLKRLEAFSSPPLPWQPVKHRRTEDAVPDARAKAEKAERAKWAAEVVKILSGTDLPYARTMGSGEPDLRCCRGLAFRTLAKRVRGMRPILRFVKAQYGAIFPASGADVVLHRCARQGWRCKISFC